MKDTGKWYFVANSIVLCLIYTVCLIMAISFINNIVIRIIVCVITLIGCASFEEKVLSRFVNDLVEKILKEELK